MIENSCKHAHDLVIGIGQFKGASVQWKPQINQGLVRFTHPNVNATEEDHDAFTDLVIEKINESGKLFVGGTNWNGKRCMRISVCGWQTDEEDVTISLKAVKEVLNDAIADKSPFNYNI